jgi:hypothetical protein
LLSFACFALMMLLAADVWCGGEPKAAAKHWKEIFVLKTLKTGDQDDKLRKLLVERYDEIAGEMKSVIALKHEADPHPWYDEALVDVSRRIFRTVLDFDDMRERKELLAEVLGQVKQLEQKFEDLEKTLKDSRTKIQLSRFRSLRMEVEFHIAKCEKK